MDTKKRDWILRLVAAVGLAAVVSAASVSHAPQGEKLYRDERTADGYYAETGENGVTLYVDNFADNRTMPPEDNTGTADTVVDINNASVWELAGVLPGIGETKAKRIVEYRETVGGFRSVDELIEVDGIGSSLLGKIRPYCIVGDYAPDAE